MIVIRLLISFILCKIFNLVLVYLIAWPPVNQFSLTEGLPCLKKKKFKIEIENFPKYFHETF